ncbi:MAG: Gfo/Idh/MocA family oxidoreductase, partial [bacterium]|nr:Gfo/Idh/MocA family oxidoreductase [bacterium]
QKEHGIANGYRVFDDMLESDIDAVVIATPMQCHVPQAIAALQAGKHVMSEVTAGVTMNELWWLIENVEQSGKVYMMAENYCYMPDNQLILSLVKKGMLGDVYYSEDEYLHNIQSLGS